MKTTRAAIIALAATLAAAATVHAHATYNLSSYDAGLAGSTNGADGSPTTAPPATWTDGPLEGYAGALPVNWYAGMHNPTAVRTIQTGGAPNPPNGSLLARVNSYNAANDPDLPADRVLAVGGKSWTDPENEGQGWGHGLDYGLIHFSPLDELVAEGAKRFTLTLADDPADGVAVQLAFAIYGGWDTSTASVRHQTFVTSPSPVDNPLGSAGLELLGYAAATAAGQTLSATYELDPAHTGHYTVFVAALGGVAGQYQLTVATQAEPGQTADCQADLAQCTTTLNAMSGELAAATADADNDGHRDQDDACAGTPGGAAVDAAGCSQAQYCAAIAVTSKAGQNACKKADWKNDEPIMKKKALDCTYSKSARACQPKL